MKIIASRKISIAFLLASFSVLYVSAQDQNNGLSQDPRFTQLLNERRKTSASVPVTSTYTYKIQVYSGNSELAKSTLSEFKQNFPGIDATIVFNTPNYKVWVGNFKTRIEAEKNLTDIRKKYSNALMMKPSK